MSSTPGRSLLVDLDKIDFNHVVADIEEIRKWNPQRSEMEQLTAIVYLDPTVYKCVGYKDVTENEFWVRGHMPGYPLLPGVLMCEAAAQLCSYFIVANKLSDGDFIGFAGLENVRFRGTVHVGDRLVLVAKGIKIHRRQTVFNVQAFVGTSMVFHGDVIGVSMHRPAETAK